MGVDGPAVGIEDGAQVTLAEFPPGNEHGRAGNEEHDNGQDKEELPESNSLEGGGHAGQGGPQQAYAHADGGEDTGELGNVEGDGRGFSVCCGIGCLGEAGHGFLVFLRRFLVYAVTYHAGDLLVRGPESLTDRNGVVHNGNNLGGVVVALAVIEDGVLAFSQAVHVSVREDGGYVEALAQFLAGAGAVEDVHAAEAGDFRGRAVHLDAEVCAALVNVQAAGLEHGLAGGGVEIGQDNIVVQETVEVFLQVNHLVHFLDGEGVGFLGLVFFYEFQQGGLLVFLQDGVDGIKAQGFHLGALFGIHPGGVRGELAADAGPFGLREAVFRPAGQRCHLFHGGFPGGVHGPYVQNAFCRGLGYGLQGNLFGRGIQVAFDGGNLVHAHIHGGSGGGVKADELAAHEVVGHLLLQVFDGGQGVGRLVCEGENLLGAGLLPLGIVCAGGVEGVNLVGRDAGDAAAVQGRRDAGDGLDELCGGLIPGRCGRDDAVSVELGIGKNLHVVRGVFYGNAVFLEPQVAQDLTGRCLEAGPHGILGVEFVNREGVVLLKEDICILEDGGEPLGGGDDLVHADVSVAVHINVLKGLGIEFQVLDRTAEDRPHLAV